MTQEDGPWLTFTLRDTGPEGVEAPKLARLLEKLSSAMYAIARSRLGEEAARRGPHRVAEDALASIRVLRVTPGSAVIELAPPTNAQQAQLSLDDRLTPDDIALDLVEEVERIHAGEPAVDGRWDIRRRVREIVEGAGEIGSQGEIVLRPIVPRPNLPAGSVRSASFRTTGLPTEPEPQMGRRSRRVSGHAFMVDVEPGRQRMRLKLPDGRDMTLEVEESLVPMIHDSLDRVVEIDMEEEMEGSASVRKRARTLTILPSSGARSDLPPKTIAQLEKEQAMPSKRPDYVDLATEIWATPGQLSEFEEYLREIRKAGTA